MNKSKDTEKYYKAVGLCEELTNSDRVTKNFALINAFEKLLKIAKENGIQRQIDTIETDIKDLKEGIKKHYGC